MRAPGRPGQRMRLEHAFAVHSLKTQLAAPGENCKAWLVPYLLRRTREGPEPAAGLDQPVWRHTRSESRY